MSGNKNQSAIILFSGGQDSTTCLYWAKKKFDYVLALIFDYGQRHIQEVENAIKLAEQAKVKYRVLDTKIISDLTHNSLTDLSIDILEKSNNQLYPNTFVPGRNMIFLTLAASIAYDLHIYNLITGVSEADYSGYPDCRENFISSVNKSINLAMDTNFTIHTPLMHKTKSDIWKMAEELGVYDIIKNKTITCYNGIIADGCGECPACKLRQNGLEQFLSISS